jgi:hypothetical protein
MINWISTYNFLNYQASDELELEIFNKSREVFAPYKIGNAITPNSPIPFNKKTYSYPLEFLQEHYQDKIGIIQ